jgi:hypothetical protein
MVSYMTQNGSATKNVSTKGTVCILARTATAQREIQM